MNISKSEYQLEVVNRIKDLRIKADVGQTKLANLLDVVSGQIGNIESPRYQHKYTLKQLYTISKFFDVSIEYLLTKLSHLWF